MKKIIFYAILLTIILAFIFKISFFLFGEIFSQDNYYIKEGLVGAFMGAFFAFLFIRIADFLNNLYQRKKKNINALVKLEQICNENLCISRENQEQLDQFKKALEERMLFGGIIQFFSIDKTIPLGLTNIDIINESFILNTEARRLNESSKMVYSQYRKLEECFLSGREDAKKFLESNRPNLLSLINNLKNFHRNFDNKAIRLLAEVRILLRDKPLTTSIIVFLSKKRLEENKVREEETRVKKEIAESVKKSSEEIKSIKTEK